MRIGRVVTGKVGNMFVLGAVAQLAQDGSSLKAYVPGLKKVVTFNRGDAHTIDSCGGSGASRQIADQVREAAGIQVDGSPLTDAQIAKINKPVVVAKPKALPRKVTKALPTVKATGAAPRQTLASKAKAITSKVAATLSRKKQAKGKTSKAKA